MSSVAPSSACAWPTANSEAVVARDEATG
jgi:hypothetical protein